MSKKFQVYDTSNGRVVSNIFRVSDSVKLTGVSFASGEVDATAEDTTGLWPGMLLIGKNIPTGTLVKSIDSATTFTLNTAATGTSTDIFVVALSYIPYLPDGTLSVCDVNLEHYRDFFEDTTPVAIQGGGTPYQYRSLINARAALVPAEPTIHGDVTGADVGDLTYVNVFAGDVSFATSDHITHTPPRAQVQKCSFVHFILDDGTLVPVLRLPTYDIVPVS